MTISELGNELRNMYNSAPEKEKATFIHLFGIKYGPIILKNKYSAGDIIKASGLNDSYKTEVRKGVNLSKYVSYTK
ncbi:hypothetical protein ASG65_12190 [Bacillus sp. Leaf13]|nr:hypothetical protein ASG65_12190 [Bacillus sp. Leaf13]